MNRSIRVAALLSLAAMFLGGCVAQDKYDALADTNATSAARTEQLAQDSRTLQGSLDVKQRRIDELEGEVRQLRSINDDLNGQISGIRGRQQQLVDELGNIRLSLLDPETDSALQALAAQYPDLIKYDPQRGLLQFVSDLTFDSGSDVVKPQAKASLQRLAQILMGSSASNYDLRVIGHTDSQPLARSREKFRTNRHLSVYRSISVEEVLRQSGIPGSRVETGGWGEYRPLVPNTARGNTPQNRRVEIYVVPGTAALAVDVPDAGGGSFAPAPAQAQPAPRRELPIMK